MEQEELLKKLKEFQKKQICYFVLRVQVAAMPIAYTSDDLSRMSRDMTIKAKYEEVSDELLKIANEIGRETLEKYFKDPEWCATHKFTIAEQRAATLERLGEEWDLDKLADYAEAHS